MNINEFRKYESEASTVYYLVNDDFLSGFGRNQSDFMRTIYYNKYVDYCTRNSIKAQSIDMYLKNANKRRIKLYQHCCPFCGMMEIAIRDRKIYNKGKMRFCSNCGEMTTLSILFQQLISYYTIDFIHNVGIRSLKSNEVNASKYIIYYSMFSNIVSLATILETILRDFFLDLVSIKYHCFHKKYILDVIKKDIKNDFMNFEKANDHYVKALNIKLSDLITRDCKSNLTDLSNLRNLVVHNNGLIDDKFRKTVTFFKMKDEIIGDRIFVTKKTVEQYYNDVRDLIIELSKVYSSRFSEEKYKLIASHYINK